MSDQYFNSEMLNGNVYIGGVVWQQVEAGQNFPNDSFTSTNDGCNETQYFSMLDTSDNDMILNDINGIDELAGFDDSTLNSQQSYYNIEGSDEIFAFDAAHDQDGNVHRFRYRLRVNENGEYEGVPESIELIPSDGVNIDGSNVSDLIAAANDNSGSIIKHEIGSEVDSLECNDNPNDDDNEEIYVANKIAFLNEHDNHYEAGNGMINNKIGIVGDGTLLSIHKMEAISRCEREDVKSFDQFDDSISNSFNTNISSIEHVTLDTLTNNIHTNNGSTLILQNDDNRIHNNDHLKNKSAVLQPRHIFVTNSSEHDKPKSNHNHEDDKSSSSSSCSSFDIDNNDLNGSDSEEYDEIEGIHVTGDSEVHEDPDPLTQYKQPLLPTYLVQIPQSTPPILAKRTAKNARINYLKNPKKENLSIPQSRLIKTNPRSLLKSSYAHLEQNDNQTKKSEPAKVEKRVPKNKELVQAQLFSKFIAQTRILEAPVRQHRLPRKQTIKPVERNDEEIIVQEVVVSSKGFIETSEDGVMKSKIPLKATEIVCLTDSDDDYKPRQRKSKRKTTYQKRYKEVEVIISDSDEEENVPQNPIIEIIDEAPKKKRGRPPKHTTNNTSEKESGPIKNQNTNLPDASTINTRWKCGQCNKMFRNKMILRKHIQSHNCHELKYKCLHCIQAFKDDILLTAHLKSHKPETVTHQCFTCKKTFLDYSKFIDHNRLHMKNRMVLATDVLKCSPKPTNKLPKKYKYQHICRFCPKSFSTNELLNVHQKTHKQFSCVNCPLKFASKLMLENHMCKKCVKSAKRSIHTQRTMINKHVLVGSGDFKKPQSSNAKISLPCDNCTSKFSSYTNLYKHKVLVHNIETPDKKQILSENSVGKKMSTPAHSNIPANKNLRNAFANLKNKLDL